MSKKLKEGVPTVRMRKRMRYAGFITILVQSRKKIKKYLKQG